MRRRMTIALGALYKPGTILRGKGSTRKYIIGADQKRHWITNGDTFDACFLFRADTIDISAAEFNSIPAGSDIRTPEDFYALMPRELPEHYTHVMSKAAIDSYIKSKFGNFRKYCPDVDGRVSFSELLNPGSGDVGCLSRFSILQTIEKANLLYVNGFIDQGQLNAEYDKANKVMATLSTLKTFWKDSLLDAGKVLVSAVLGFVGTGNPIGFFVGAVGAAAKNIRDKNLRAAQVYSVPQTSLLVKNQQTQTAQAAVTAFNNAQVQAEQNKKLQASSNFKVHPALAVGALALLAFAAYRFKNQ